MVTTMIIGTILDLIKVTLSSPNFSLSSANVFSPTSLLMSDRQTCRHDLCEDVDDDLGDDDDVDLGEDVDDDDKTSAKDTDADSDSVLQ